MSKARTLFRDCLRASISMCHRVLRRRGVVLLVSRGNHGKESEVLQRAERVLGSSFDRGKLRISGSPSWWSLLRAEIALEVDAGIIAPLVRKLLRHVFAVDYEVNAYDGWELARLGQMRIPGPDATRERRKSRDRLTARVQELRATLPRPVYVFGTGPSLAAARDRSFSDGFVIVCNTIVRDPDLFAHLDPDFVVAGDAIYHFGFTSHALAFRRDLLARLKQGGSRPLFVYPELFDRIVRREFGEVEHLLVPVPFGEHTDVTVDLAARFELPALGNVLNGLLLPLACTLSREVRLWGFDGRAPDDKLFWSNSTKHAYPELMPDLVAAHPAFYQTLVPKGKESSYVKSVHGDELDRRLSAAEEKGFTFEMLHKSWTETLNKRRRTPD